MRIAELLLAHPGSTCTIVAPGPSVRFIKAEHVADGPIIAIYDAIVPVEALGLPNSTYALQKDGGFVCGCDHDCERCTTAGMVRPQRAPLLLHEPESGDCFPGHPRYVFGVADDLGFEGEGWSNSATCAVRLAYYMGATALRLVSFDACTTGDLQVIEGGTAMSYDENAVAYPWACECIRRDTADIETAWVTPCAS